MFKKAGLSKKEKSENCNVFLTGSSFLRKSSTNDSLVSRCGDKNGFITKR